MEVIVTEHKSSVVVKVNGFKTTYRNATFDYNSHRVTTKFGVYKVRTVLNCPYIYIKK